MKEIEGTLEITQHSVSEDDIAKEEYQAYLKIADKYAEILKCATHYDMEHHQRKLKKMEEKRQMEEEQFR